MSIINSFAAFRFSNNINFINDNLCIVINLKEPGVSTAKIFLTLSGNSVYGHSIMNKSKHTCVNFCSSDQAAQLINDPRFISLDEFDGDCFEVNYKFKFMIEI